jgi:hypothetical protein
VSSSHSSKSGVATPCYTLEIEMSTFIGGRKKVVPKRKKYKKHSEENNVKCHYIPL